MPTLLSYIVSVIFEVYAIMASKKGLPTYVATKWNKDTIAQQQFNCPKVQQSLI